MKSILFSLLLMLAVPTPAQETLLGLTTQGFYRAKPDGNNFEVINDFTQTTGNMFRGGLVSSFRLLIGQELSQNDQFINFHSPLECEIQIQDIDSRIDDSEIGSFIKTTDFLRRDLGVQIEDSSSIDCILKSIDPMMEDNKEFQLKNLSNIRHIGRIFLKHEITTSLLWLEFEDEDILRHIIIGLNVQDGRITSICNLSEFSLILGFSDFYYSKAFYSGFRIFWLQNGHSNKVRRKAKLIRKLKIDKDGFII